MHLKYPENLLHAINKGLFCVDTVIFHLLVNGKTTLIEFLM